MERRGFLGAILAACAAPAIIRVDSLMRIVPREALVEKVEVLYGSDLVANVYRNEALRILRANIGFLEDLNSEWDAEYKNFDRLTLQVRKPNRFELVH